jgi:hypothetical protein
VIDHATLATPSPQQNGAQKTAELGETPQQPHDPP